MALTQLSPPFPIFTDRTGRPLDGGYLYFGEVDQDPETAPITVYFDSDLTQPAVQPLRTSAGYVMRDNAPALLYAPSKFSVTVKDKQERLVIYAPSTFGLFDETSLLFADNNLSDVSNAATARENLGLTIGSNVQAFNPSLTQLGTTLAGSSTNGIEINQQGSGNRPAFADFHSSGLPGTNDFSARLIRNASANGTFDIVQTGTGAIRLLGPVEITGPLSGDGVGGVVLGPFSTASGTQITVTGIPSWATEVVIHIDELSFTSGTASDPAYLVRLGTSSGAATTGYQSRSCMSDASGNALAGASNGFAIRTTTTGFNPISGTITLNKRDGNLWQQTHSLFSDGASFVIQGSGDVGLSGTLDRVLIVLAGGPTIFGCVTTVRCR